MASLSFFSFPAGLLGAPNSGGGSHKKDALSNRRGVPGVPGEEIAAFLELQIFFRFPWCQFSSVILEVMNQRKYWPTAEALFS
jgi:hypothetical protein